MNGIESCSHGCVYCSAATTLNYAQGVNHKDLENSLKKIDDKTYSEFKADFTKVAETFEHNTRFRKAKEIQEKQGIQAEVHIDLWGGDPVTNHLATIECVDFLKDFFENKHGMKLSISSSTGGLPLARRDIVDYYIENKITLQISHDGCGQWMRTGEIDPLYDERMAGNIAVLFNNGTLNMINDCLNFYNNDVFANKDYM
jgi:sulfatase maturation enzyme AslB (radical SAM superfamily)